jgi:hypothetical protein
VDDQKSPDSKGSDTKKGSMSRLAKATGKLRGMGAPLTGRAGSLGKEKEPARQQSLTDVDRDTKKRTLAMTTRQREDIEMQSDPEDGDRLRSSLGINRQKKDGSWE